MCNAQYDIVVRNSQLFESRFTFSETEDGVTALRIYQRPFRL